MQIKRRPAITGLHGPEALPDEIGIQNRRNLFVVFGNQNQGCHGILLMPLMPSGAAGVERAGLLSIKPQHSLHTAPTRRADRGAEAA